MNLFGNKFTDKDANIHVDPIECSGCHEKFGINLHRYNADDDERYCRDCYFYRYGLKELQFSLSKLNAVQIELWTNPIEKIDPEVRKIIKFIGKKNEDNK